MKHQEIRDLYLSFFESRGYKVIPSTPVFLLKDPTLLFVNAGMNVFKSIFLGQEESPFEKVVNIQKCIRISGKHNDLNMVGQDDIHHTFFEMLGLWTFKGNFKKEAIEFAFEFLTQSCKIPIQSLWVTVHEKDQDSVNIVSQLEISKDRCISLEQENFWDMGDIGPCGYCVEFHLDLGPERCTCGGGDTKNHLQNSCHRFIEIWNIVFIEYDRQKDGSLIKLSRCYVDGGMGLERLTRVLNHLESNYQSDLFSPIQNSLQKMTNHSNLICEKNLVAYQVILDHIRSIVFSVSDGVVPSNEGRGYVIRRLIRRALNFGRKLGLVEKPFLYQLVSSVVEGMQEVYPDLLSHCSFIEETILREEKGFIKTLSKGLQLFEEKSQILQEIGKQKKRKKRKPRKRLEKTRGDENK